MSQFGYGVNFADVDKFFRFKKMSALKIESNASLSIAGNFALQFGVFQPECLHSNFGYLAPHQYEDL